MWQLNAGLRTQQLRATDNALISHPLGPVTKRGERFRFPVALLFGPSHVADYSGRISLLRGLAGIIHITSK